MTSGHIPVHRNDVPKGQTVEVGFSFIFVRETYLSQNFFNFADLASEYGRPWVRQWVAKCPTISYLSATC